MRPADGVICVQAATAASVLAWMLLDSLHGKVSLLGACAGAVTGLVVITPAAGFVGAMGAAAMGVIGVVVCRCATPHGDPPYWSVPEHLRQALVGC